MNSSQQAYVLSSGTTSVLSTSGVIFNRNPTPNDVNYPIARLWFNISNETVWYLNNQTNLSGNLQSNWVQISFGSTAIINVPQGGTGSSSYTPFSIITAGATSTSPLQNVSGVGVASQVLTSNGPGALPTWQNSTASNAVTSITTSTGTSPVMPSSGNISVLGNGSITTFGSMAEVTVELTGLTQYDILVGQGTTTIGLIAPSATVGVPLVSTGGSSYPAFGTATVSGGGTGDTSFTAYSVITGGTTSTGALQNVSGVGTSGQVLTSQGPGNLPSWQTSSASGAVTSITTSTGTSPVMPSSGNISVLGNGSITTFGSMAEVTVELTGLTQYDILVGQGTTTIGLITPSATVGVPLVSTGGSSYPAFGTATVSGGGTGDTSFTPFSLIAGGTTSTGQFQSLTTGIAGQYLVSTGPTNIPQWQTVSPSGQGVNVIVFGGSTGGPGTFTYTPSAGMTSIIVEGIGSGGYGGAIPATPAGSYAVSGGGASGSYTKGYMPASVVGSSQPVVIAASSNNPSSGITSTFGTGTATINFAGGSAAPTGFYYTSGSFPQVALGGKGIAGSYGSGVTPMVLTGCNPGGFGFIYGTGLVIAGNGASGTYVSETSGGTIINGTTTAPIGSNVSGAGPGNVYYSASTPSTGISGIAGTSGVIIITEYF
jgi:hypothetical protein